LYNYFDVIPAVAASSMVLFSHRTEAATAALLLMRPKICQLKVMIIHKDTLQFIKHVYNDPNLGISLFCKPGVKIVASCQIYGSSLPNACLVGIEYIITAKVCNSLPKEEKPNWFIINKILATTVQVQFPELNAQQANAILQHLLGITVR
jgi:hypothetical protein